MIHNSGTIDDLDKEVLNNILLVKHGTVFLQRVGQKKSKSCITSRQVHGAVAYVIITEYLLPWNHYFILFG